MRAILRLTTLMVIVLSAGVSESKAQLIPASTDQWSRGTTLQVLAGAANSETGTAGTFGAGLGWEVNHRLELEGVGTWVPRQNGVESFTAEFRSVLNVLPPKLTVPYLLAGVGMYHSEFDAGATLPTFYQQRLTTRTHPTFSDTSFVFGGGANLYVSRHFSFRPEVNLKLITDGNSIYHVTTVNMSFAFHVEDHPRGD
jgi:hypothetical protein